MNREDIIKLARDAGLYVGRNISGVQLVGSSYEEGGLLVHLTVEELKRFAELVRADEREVCAKACEETTASWTQDLYNSGCMDCAAAIRARGEQ